jgi:hypothetical protein
MLRLFRVISQPGFFSVIAFHEKAGRSQVGSFWFLWVTSFLSAESPLSPPC